MNDTPMKLIQLMQVHKKLLKQALMIILIFAGLQATAQNEYRLFKSYEPFKPDSTGNFYFAVDNVNFFKNNENKLERSIDYTITGTLPF